MDRKTAACSVYYKIWPSQKENPILKGSNLFARYSITFLISIRSRCLSIMFLKRTPITPFKEKSNFLVTDRYFPNGAHISRRLTSLSLREDRTMIQ